jgi:hypothetical protein
MKYIMESYVYRHKVNRLVESSREIECPITRKSTDINTYIKIWLRI